MRKSPFVFLLACAAVSWPVWAFQSGVLSAKAMVEPERMLPDGKARITVEAVDGFQKPIPMASIKVSTDTGYFEPSGNTMAFGFTDKEGRFQVVWHGNLRTVPGTHNFDITVSKSGYIGKYPVTARVKLDIEDPAKAGGGHDKDNPGLSPSESPSE